MSPEKDRDLVPGTGEDGKDIDPSPGQEGHVLDNILNEIPEGPAKKELFMSLQRFGPAGNPFLEKIAEKVNDQHIDKVIDLAAKDDKFAFEDAKRSRFYGFLYFSLSMLVFIFLTVFLMKVDKNVYLEVLKYLVAFLGGFGGGYGFKSYIDRD